VNDDAAPSFRDYLASLSEVSTRQLGIDPETEALCRRATEKVNELHAVDVPSVARLVRDDPHIIPVLAAAVGLSQERLRTWLKQHFGTAGWVTVGGDRADEIVAQLDEDLELIDRLQAQAERKWTWADVLARTMAPRQSASRAVQQGRDLEDIVELQVAALGVGFESRTRFTGRGNRTAPADFALPSAEKTFIAVAVKGFDSTGSKLGDAAREIEEMADVRTPHQYVFAVVDGLGWLRRQSDLRRIYELREQLSIEGLFTQRSLGDFGAALQDAARRLRLV